MKKQKKARFYSLDNFRPNTTRHNEFTSFKVMHVSIVLDKFANITKNRPNNIARF